MALVSAASPCFFAVPGPTTVVYTMTFCSNYDSSKFGLPWYLGVNVDRSAWFFLGKLLVCFVHWGETTGDSGTDYGGWFFFRGFLIWV